MPDIDDNILLDLPSWKTLKVQVSKEFLLPKSRGANSIPASCAAEIGRKSNFWRSSSHSKSKRESKSARPV